MRTGTVTKAVGFSGSYHVYDYRLDSTAEGVATFLDGLGSNRPSESLAAHLHRVLWLLDASELPVSEVLVYVDERARYIEVRIAPSGNGVRQSLRLYDGWEGVSLWLRVGGSEGYSPAGPGQMVDVVARRHAWTETNGLQL